ncbi:MAG TPA: HD domain-containing phosphohydrolase [Burkholderiaceae bacterium]|nr:HD domain-containing phosphohydrolase [Burkholderiaceae bacterium]
MEPARRVECLLSIAQQFYHQGQSVFSGVEPAALAVMLATDTGNPALRRKSLTFQGIILSTTNNPGDALLSLAEGLRLAEELADPVGIASVWNGLGMAFYEAALYADARQCYERAHYIAAEHADLQYVAAVSLSNAAMCCLHVNALHEGIERISKAIAIMPAPSSPAHLLARVFGEGTYIRLLLLSGGMQKAGERVQLAKRFAVETKSVRADISAACSEGLVEVYSGIGDIGLSRGMQALEKAREVKPSLRETLLAMVQAHEKAGRPERALALHRELTLNIRKAQHENIVRHQELHLKQLEADAASQFPSQLLEDKDAELTEKIAAQTVGTKQGRLLEQMAFTAEMRDDPTGEHCYRVAKLAALLAQAHGASPQMCATIELAARLHDIGKVGIPDTLMQKPTLLSDGERQILETHAKTGAELLSRTKVSYGDLAEDIARHHHERWDGHGYPDGIFGSAIPLAARIVAVCDVYDAMTHDKAYRRALSGEEALAEMIRGRALQFDPKLIDLFGPMITRLRAEHADLDAFLGQAARQTALTVARQKIAESLARPIESVESERQLERRSQ